MPMIVFGAAGSARASVKEAMDIGFRAIDTVSQRIRVVCELIFGHVGLMC